MIAANVRVQVFYYISQMIVNRTIWFGEASAKLRMRPSRLEDKRI